MNKLALFLMAAIIAAFYFGLIVIFLALAGCVTSAEYHHRVNARVTFYHKHEDKFGSQIAMSNKYHAREGRTMAAPRVLPFNTSVTVPQLRDIVGDGKFNIEDRGSALERYYQRGQLRLDVYVSSREKCQLLGGSLPEFMEAELR